MRTHPSRGLSTWALAFLAALLLWPAAAAIGQGQGGPGQRGPGQRGPAQRGPQENAAAASPSMAAFRQAYELTKTAKVEEELTAIVDLCQKGLQEGANEAETKYAHSLLAWTFNKRGEVRANAGQDETALADFEEAIKLDDTRWPAYHNRGVSHGMAGNLEAALADFNRLVQLNPNFPKGFYNRGEVRFKQGDVNGAVDDYSRCLRLAPNDSAAYTSRGFAFYSRGDYRNAMRDYGQAIQTDRNNAEAYTHRGDAYADQAQFPQALNDYQAAVRVDPQFGRAYQSAAWLRATCPIAQFRNPQQALDAAQKAIELDDDGEYRYLDTLAAAQANAGNFDEAKQTIAKAIETATAVSTSQAFLDRLEQRRQLYEAGKPYRDVRPGAPQPR